jgi:S1-C subfamily serine protease
VDAGEMSAYGVGRRAVLVLEVSPESVLAKGGLQKGDVILSWNGTAVDDANTLAARAQMPAAGQSATAGIWRNQQEMTLKIAP